MVSCILPVKPFRKDCHGFAHELLGQGNLQGVHDVLLDHVLPHGDRLLNPVHYLELLKQPSLLIRAIIHTELVRVSRVGAVAVTVLKLASVMVEIKRFEHLVFCSSLFIRVKGAVPALYSQHLLADI